MSTPRQPEAIGPQAGPWRLRHIRALALCSLLAMLVLVPWCGVLFLGLGLNIGVFLPVLFCPLWLPYVWLIWALPSNADAQAVKKTLAVGVGFGSLILILFSYLLVEISFEAGWQALRVEPEFGSRRSQVPVDRAFLAAPESMPWHLVAPVPELIKIEM